MNNIFNIRAAEEGRAFIQKYPQATGVDIDEAAPRLNPARRHFQDAARDMKATIKEVYYRWEVTCADGSQTVSFTDTAEEATAEANMTAKLYKQDGKKIASIIIENHEGHIVVGIMTRKP